MRLWADIYEANGERQGDGPVIALTGAGVTRALDGAGSISVSVPGSNERALKLITNEARARVYVQQMNVIRELGRGILRKIDVNETASNLTMSASGPDSLDELKRISVKYNRAYSDKTVAEVAADLVALVPGWSVNCTVSALVSARFDGVSVLKALQKLAEMQGLHLRQTPEQNVIEVGAFGTDAGLTLVNKKQAPAGVYENHEIALIESIKVTSSSETVFNRLYPFGAGQNVDMALTLAKSTRTSPYAIRSEVVNGRRIYYLENEGSIRLYGLIEKDAQFKDVGALSNGDADQVRAANGLYDAASAALDRAAWAQNTYKIVVVKATKTVRPGDKVRVVYKGVIETENGLLTYRDIDGMFWVMKASERISNQGVTLEMDVSDIDKYEMDSARVVIGALEQIRIQGMTVQPTANHYQVPIEPLLIDEDTPGRAKLNITDKCYDIDQILMYVRTVPFVATAKGSSVVTSEGGGDHRHLVLSYSNISAVAGQFTQYSGAVDSGGANALWGMYKISGLVADSLWTHSSSGTHTHSIPAAPLVYGLNKDNQRPAGMTITVNGVVVASGIGAAEVDLETTIDITDAIKNKSGGFKDTQHEITIVCVGGQGAVLLNFDVYEVMTPLKYSS